MMLFVELKAIKEESGIMACWRIEEDNKPSPKELGMFGIRNLIEPM